MIFSNDTKIPVIALEGMPHSGKTSIMMAIDRLKRNDILLIDEIYFDKQQLKALNDKRGTITESKWFIDQEIKRGLTLKDRDLRLCKLILVDRTYLSTLAYGYARSKINRNPKEFKELSEYARKHCKSILKYDSIIVFCNDVQTTINRRNDLKKKDAEYWNNQEFMGYFQEFYTKKLSTFYHSNLLSLDVSSLGIDEIVHKVLRHLSTEGLILRKA